MSDVQVSAERRREIEGAHRQWARSFPGTISSLIEGSPTIVPGRIETYSDFDPVRFLSVNPRFVEFLILHDIAADIIDGDTIHTI